jgi:signal transduction histidine kinase
VSEPASPLRILLVEDNPGDARLIREFLREAGLVAPSVEVATTLSAATTHLTESAPDILLLDLSLPDAHGLETVTAALSAAPTVPIVVLTGLDDENLALLAVQSGAQDYLVKGRVDGPALGRSIRYAIERKQLAREREQLLSREREARSRAESAVQARDQVLRVVSHDLGNHLAAVRVNARVLSRTVAQQGTAEDNLQRAEGILQQVAAMERLRQDLLDVVSLEAGRLSMAREPIDPGAIARQAADDLRPVAVVKGVEVKALVPEELPSPSADPDRLRQALGNLLGNAIKFSPAATVVDLAVTVSNGEVLFTVTDSGPGVPVADEPYIFDSFWKSAAGNPTGAGLGLSIVKGIAEAHSGRVWYERRPEGGSIFRLAIPGV